MPGGGGGVAAWNILARDDSQPEMAELIATYLLSSLKGLCRESLYPGSFHLLQVSVVSK